MNERPLESDLLGISDDSMLVLEFLREVWNPGVPESNLFCL